jgi:DNA-binding transcriptional MocR family regulator
MMTWDAVLATRAKRMSASEIRELLKLLDQPDIISFAGGIPDPALFPADAFRTAYADALSGDGAAAGLQYSVSEGSLRLRRWLVGEMAKLGVSCGPENILITSGSQQALDFLGKLFLSANDTALVGWPTYLGALAGLQCLRAELRPA